jgi:hypothetical protein
MIRLAVENSPVEAAWAAFDAAAIAFHSQYAAASVMRVNDTAGASAARMKAAEEVARLWDEWRALFLAESDPRPAA